MAERINAVKTSFFGKGAIRLLGPELQKMGIRRALLVTDRSEERRVGKECRSRWSPYH